MNTAEALHAALVALNAARAAVEDAHAALTEAATTHAHATTSDAVARIRAARPTIPPREVRGTATEDAERRTRQLIAAFRATQCPPGEVTHA
jgi:hypothetical protein